MYDYLEDIAHLLPGMSPEELEDLSDELASLRAEIDNAAYDLGYASEEDAANPFRDYQLAKKFSNGREWQQQEIYNRENP